MKKFLFGCVLAVSGLTMPFASANDFCCPPSCDPCGYCCEDFNGLYVGGNIGVLSHTSHRNDLDGFLSDNSGWSVIDTSFTAGVQLGYDWQCCNKLIGLVVDWNWINTRRRVRDDPNGVGANFHNVEGHWFTTIRARAGLSVCDALVYVTAGAAVTRFEYRWGTVTDEFRHHRHRWGWVGGVGTEFLLGCGWSVGAEVLFFQFDHHERTFTSAGGALFTFGHSDSLWLARVLLNYRFGDLCSFCCR